MILNLDKDPLPDLRSGIWRHYKGPLYQVIGYGHNASDNNKPVVAYFGCELDTAKTGGRIAFRDVEEFFATVCPFHDGETVYDPRGEAGFSDIHLASHAVNPCNTQSWVERFEYLGPVYLKGMETR